MSSTAIPAVQEKIVKGIAGELGVNASQVAAAVALLDEGATVPFIARYRKEVTGNLDDTQLRILEERLLCLRELEDRPGAIIASIEEQGKMTDALRQAIEFRRRVVEPDLTRSRPCPRADASEGSRGLEVRLAGLAVLAALGARPRGGPSIRLTRAATLQPASPPPAPRN